MGNDIKSKLIKRVQENPYLNHLGIEFTSIEKGKVTARMPLVDEQKQYSGIIHGGVVSALADTIAGFAAYTVTPVSQDVLTAQLNVSFLRGAWGNELIAKGYVVKSGRRVHFAECEVYCNDIMITKASGTFCIVNEYIKQE